MSTRPKACASKTPSSISPPSKSRDPRRHPHRRKVDLILDDIGLPTGGINLAFGGSDTISNSDGDILISLHPGTRETLEYQRRLRADLARKFPGATFFFSAANITNQILDFGLPSPIDVQVTGRDKGNYELTQRIQKRVAAIPGAVDVHIHQQVTYPTLQVDVDRTKAREIGLTQQDVAQSTLISLTGTGQTAPNEWLNPLNGVNYQIVTQTPIYRSRQPSRPRQHPRHLAYRQRLATARQPRHFPPRRVAHHHQSLQHPAHLRHLRQRRPPRPGRRRHARSARSWPTKKKACPWAPRSTFAARSTP